MGFEDTPNNYNPPDKPQVSSQLLKFSENTRESIPEFNEHVFEKVLLGEPSDHTQE